MIVSYETSPPPPKKIYSMVYGPRSPWREMIIIIILMIIINRWDAVKCSVRHLL